MYYFKVTLENSGELIYIAANTQSEIQNVMIRFLASRSVDGKLHEPADIIRLTKKQRRELKLKKVKEPGVLKVVSGTGH